MTDRRDTRVLVVDDEAAIADGIADTLEELGYTVIARCNDASSALARARDNVPTIALVDIRLHGEESGIELASALRTELAVPVIFMTAFADAPTIARVKRACAAACLLKPVTEQDLHTAIEITLARHRATLKEAAAERVAAASRVANGLAHEINNPLAYLSTNLELALESLAAIEGDPAHATERLRSIQLALSEAKEGADRVRGIVTDMTAFAAASVPASVAVDLASVLRAAWAIACGDVRGVEKWELVLDDVAPVEGDEVQLVQLFTRILQNAVQYLRPGRVHQVSLRTSTDDRGVTVEIRDNGRGIPREMQARVFDPFFTTRGAKAGRGLGLAVAAGIVRAHLGEITLESTPDVGTLVRIWLPRQLRTARATPSNANAPLVAKARPRVLVIDDEPAIARSIQRMLGAEYDVHAVGDGPSAIAAIERASFDAVLCDVTLPGMEGTEVFTEIERRKPMLAQRLVFITGGTFSRRSQAFLDSLPNKTIRKPFAVEEIRSALREMLRGANDQPAGK